MLFSRSHDVDLNLKKKQALPIRSVYEEYLCGVPVMFHNRCPIPVESAKRSINVCSAFNQASHKPHSALSGHRGDVRLK